MRYEIQLPQADVIALNATKLRWETIRDGGYTWLIIHERPLPQGFDLSRTDTALSIPPMYPDAQIDSVWFSPCPRPRHGAPLHPLSDFRFDGRTWLRLCRHRTKQNAWRPGVDDIASHLAHVDLWLLQSLGRTL